MHGHDITAATHADRQGVLDLLARAALPTAGLEDHWRHVIVAHDEDRVVGSAALEVYADGALLRSVAVDSRQRGTGLGLRLTAAAIQRATDLGMPALYLLTTTAERFFPKFGFEPIDRREVPPSVQQSIEFTAACPASALVMRKRLL
jgi:amino-acid N-acetyltransferase